MEARLKLIVFEQDVFILAALIALDLVIFLYRFAAHGIDILADDAVAALSAEGVEANLFIFGGGRVIATGQVTSESFR